MTVPGGDSLLLGLVGHPVAHSLSPRIQQLFAAQFSLGLDYRLFDIAPAEFAGFIHRCLPAQCQGLNVTVPHKQAAHALCEVLSDRAWRAGAVNTLWCDGHVLHGDNTDGVGLVRDLRQNLGQELAGASIMIIGAGGASRGIIGPLLEAGAGSMWIANRTAERARALGEVFASKGKVSWSGLDRLPGHTLDLLINASSAGHEGEFPELPPTLVNDEQTLCYDLSYGAAAKPFLDWAARAGASRRVDGLGMLVEQAAESFHIWTGRHANTGPVLRALKSKAA